MARGLPLAVEPQPRTIRGVASEIPWQAIKPDTRSATPLYMQLARKLAAAIRNGSWHTGDALPSERTLASVLSVSRITARQAMALLVEERLIRRVQGAGTFVAPCIDDAFASAPGLVAMRHLSAGDGVMREWSRTMRMASADEVVQLGLSPGDEVAQIQRLRPGDEDFGIAYEISMLPAIVTGDSHEIGDSLHAFLAARGLPVERELQRIAAINAPGPIAAHLQIEPATAILRITRVSYTEARRAIALTHLYCRNGYSERVAELRNPSTTLGA
jgi:GntR family transcriptional regulator